MPNPNYHQKRRQKELSRKSRQDQKQQRRLAKSNADTVAAAATALPEDPVAVPDATAAVES